MHSYGHPQRPVISVLVLAVLVAALLGPKLTTAIRSPWGEMRVKHQWNDIPDSWVALGHPPNGSKIDLHIALKPNCQNALIDALHEVSQPGSPKYGAHLTKEQVADLVAPHPDTLELVNSWLKYNGVRPSSISTAHSGGWLAVTGVPVSQANELLGSSYQLYYHASTNETILRTVGYALPTALHKHVQTVAPTTAFTSTRLLEQIPRSRPGGAAANSTLGRPVNLLSRDVQLVHPSFLRSVYRTEDYTPVAMEKNRLGIAGLESEYPSQGDLEAFMANFRFEGVTATFDPVPFDPGVGSPYHLSQGANFETQYSVGISYPTPVIFYTGGGGNPPQIWPNGRPSPGDSYFKWLDHMLNLPTVPQTINVGYGTYETTIPTEYAEALCLLFAELGVRGASVLAGSGYDGVGDGDCVHFYTVFPASCPFVTSVGGTTGNPPEVAHGRSGGGFSNHFARPDFQDFAVTAFLLELGTEYSGLYNPWGRGVPDIAVQSSDYVYVFEDAFNVASGTICATSLSANVQTAAGIVALLNDYQLSLGRPPLGWLNPWLYGSGWSGLGLNDVTYGNNPGCDTLGFNATVGWDPVTGLGSLNFERLSYLLPVSSSQDQKLAPP